MEKGKERLKKAIDEFMEIYEKTRIKIYSQRITHFKTCNYLKFLIRKQMVRMLNSIGEELTEGKVRNHIEKLREHPFLVFNYTGMYWTEKDIPKIKEWNRKMQEFYLKTVEKLR